MTTLPQKDVTGVLRFHGWSRSDAGNFYMVFSVNGETCEWYLRGKLSADLIDSEVICRVAEGRDRLFLCAAEPLYLHELDDRVSDSEVAMLEEILRAPSRD